MRNIYDLILTKEQAIRFLAAYYPEVLIEKVKTSINKEFYFNNSTKMVELNERKYFIGMADGWGVAGEYPEVDKIWNETIEMVKRIRL